ncbi:hypothetical protein BC332_04508 [Capsicum chinense]|nr:hypothetical protein BC332_04508 [Capsicum chinense]
MAPWKPPIRISRRYCKKMVQGSRQWHEKLPFALLGYRTTVLTSTGATPYLLAYGTEAVIPAEFKIPSLRVIVEVEAKGKFSQNWQDPFIVKKVLPNGALYLTDIEGKMAEMTINADAVKRYYVWSPLEEQGDGIISQEPT